MMRQEQNHNEFDKLFKQRLDGYEMTGSDELWTNIESNFDQIDAERKKNKRFIFFKWLSAGLGVLLLSTVGYYEWRLSANQEKFAQAFSTESNSTTSTISESKIQPLANSQKPTSSNSNEIHEQSKSKLSGLPTNNKQENASIAPSNHKFSSTSKSAQNLDHLVTDNISNLNSTPPSSESSFLTTNSKQTQTSINQTTNENAAALASDLFIGDSISLCLDSRNLYPITEPSTRMSGPSLLANTEEKPNQESPKNKIQIWKHFSVMPYFSPEYNYRRLSEASENISKDENLNDFVNQETGAFGYATGLQLNYKLGKSLSIYSGFQYNLHKQNFNSNGATFTVDPVTKDYTLRTSLGAISFNESQIENPNNITITNDQTDLSFSSYQKISSFKIPLGLTYTFHLKPKQKIFIQSGILYSFNTNSKSRIRLGSNEGGIDGPDGGILIQNFEGLQQNNFDLTLGLGYEVFLGQKISFVLHPNFRTSITPIQNQFGYKTFPYAIGLITGLKIQF